MGGEQQQQLRKGPKEPPLEKPKLEGGAIGRDLKEIRSRREVIEEDDESKRDTDEDEEPRAYAMEGREEVVMDTACFNDPLCAEKFSRNPVSDSLVDRDFAKIMKVGSRSLLSDSEASETNLTKKVRSL